MTFASSIIGITVDPPNDIAVIPLTVDNLQATRAVAQTQYATALSDLQTAAADLVIVANVGSGTVTFNNTTMQFSGTVASSPSPTQTQIQTALTAFNAAFTAFLQITAIVLAAQNTTPGVNGVVINVDNTAVPNCSTLSSTLAAALAWARNVALLPP